jgi:exocyst complex component 1
VETIESQFQSSCFGPELPVRQTANEMYEKISKTMFDSLHAIAKDAASHQASGGSKDDDDKEQLNSHISIIENMHYYHETVDNQTNPTLTYFKTKAQTYYLDHLGLYVKTVIRRPLGRLLVCPLYLYKSNVFQDFLQGVETFVVSNPSEDVTARISFSKSAFKKVLSHYDTKEIRKGIDLLHKRVDKHFGQVSDDGDLPYSAKGPTIAKTLVQDVWRECQKEYDATVELCERTIVVYYPEGVQMEFTLNDVHDAFSKRSS